MPIVAEHWYDHDPDLTQKYQGDLLIRFPFPLPPLLNPTRFLLRPAAPATMTDALRGDVGGKFTAAAEALIEDAWAYGPELVFGRVAQMPAIVVTQSCDLDRRTHVQVAPVYAASALGGNLGYLRENRIGYLFYLPACPPDLAVESFADLSQMATVPRDSLAGVDVALRLSVTGTIALQAQLAKMHGRAFTFNNRDEVPQATDYMCFACFGSHARVTIKRFEVSDNFVTCEQCGNALWMKAPTR